ncbi:MAG: thioredoxin-disulfide reductase [Candidatus Doudnabacteria bacterium RIFCSPHIGHO2_02_FULL_48_21]|uniref:Thioredoxin reductase n=1 Tax=Candidatus Doudnabacteria bacterium RIFCSPLOWO2_02_FULL_48_13 TaxID=1817845 RepID=A0A1F5QCX7_9BACT|nr:MAG: thioredoxin-disulfide reductase [Candidatus Doudnabacteria bacterium RIFCSPHIGHO2_01_48_18]OGE77481.1 MAG: thioredoxin-disulfide reductase [Candidatus Doudnabacteria bacterium RIFCSPHIGHO2_01_FULL_48_180]OGE91540.1 MAG: thioredoxin-disulfide reductase [Candidatus Doudnabacteria bacterium RIFCSPHIGHO2_12_FULL_47_25]OGE93130.1 MAG: thioredoxin-disulfide reductase [Candidatus Doudnabacteria bacterium RIFCSPHIGHO2_02_FULL_48_21]OGE99996.1 MAG: thioredoxin-disulfide reductase [Candidatus Dou
MSSSNQEAKLAIIGSGPAGLTAGIYASRAELAPLLFAGTAFGGQLMLTTEVGNYPGHETDIMGPDLIQKMIAQAKRFGTEIIFQNVDKVDFTGRPFKLWSDNKEYQAEAVIIATGANAMWLGLKSEQKLIGRGVSSCAPCDGFFFKNKKVAVVGGGDTAMEEATFLTKFASEVTVIHRRDSLRASKIMQKRAMDNPKIKWIWDTTVEEVLGADAVSGLKLKNLKTGAESNFEADGLFVAIGHIPNTKFLEGSGVELDEKGYIKVFEGSPSTSLGTSKTSTEGVFVAGDVHDHVYRQAITAAAAGCKAAMDAERWLAENN